MRTLLLSIVSITTFACIGQIDLCANQKIIELGKSKYTVNPDFNLPIITVKNQKSKDYLKSIKVPEFILGMAHGKYYDGVADSNIYRINLETEEILSFSHLKNGVLPTGERYKWKTGISVDGKVYLYKFSKKKSIPLNIYVVNYSTMKLDLFWETGLMISSKDKLDNITSTKYWFLANDHGDVKILDGQTKSIALNHQFNISDEFYKNPKAQFMISIKKTSKSCKSFNYSIMNYKTKEGFLGQYDFNKKIETISKKLVGNVHEWNINKTPIWAVFNYKKESQDLTIYNTNLSKVLFDFKDIKKSGYKWEWDKNGKYKTLIITFASGKIEYYDWNSKKLVKTENKKAEIEIEDF